MSIKTVAVFSTGEMGHNVARVLKEHGLRVVTTLAGRSRRTADLAAKAGADILPTLSDAVTAADLIISIVAPSGAMPLAQAVAGVLEATRKPVLYADANAVSAATAQGIESLITGAGGRFVDVSIIGAAKKVGKSTVFYVSGTEAEEFAELSRFGLLTEVLGNQAGQASAFKIVYAGLTKGLMALMLEQLILAHGLGILDKVVERYRAKFPDLVKTAEETLPGMPFRAARRSDEMEELTETLKEEGLTPIMAPASKRMLASVGALNLRGEYTDADEAAWDLKAVMALLYPRLHQGKGK